MEAMATQSQLVHVRGIPARQQVKIMLQMQLHVPYMTLTAHHCSLTRGFAILQAGGA
jgi:hypothetical protein